MAHEAVESASVTLRGSHEFLVNNYSLCKGIGVGAALESEVFMVGGYQWTICFYPDGGDVIAHAKGYTSLCVCLKSKIISPLEFFWEVSLLDQSCRGNHVVFTYSREHNRRDLHAINCGSLSGYPEFIERATIEPSDYLKDDCLKISCTIEILAPHIQELSLQNDGSDFNRLLEGKEGADVFFRVDGECFCAHKCLLAVCFPAFWSLFSYTYQRKEIVIDDMQPCVFKAVLQFIYTGTFAEEKNAAFGHQYSFLAEMLLASHKFELERLKTICERRIMKYLTQDTVGHLLNVADLYRATDLKAACLRFLAENRDAVSTSEGTHYLKTYSPLLYSKLELYMEDCEMHSKAKEIGLVRKLLHALDRSWYFADFRPLPSDTVEKMQKKKEV